MDVTNTKIIFQGGLNLITSIGKRTYFFVLSLFTEITYWSSKYNPILFTNANDNSVRENISGYNDATSPNCQPHFI